MAKLTPTMTADELRASWQGRVLSATRHRPLGIIVISIIAHTEDDATEPLLHAVFPNFAGLRPPGLISAAKIHKTGCIVANAINKNGERCLDVVLFHNERHLEGSVRRLADEIKLNDADRKELFSYVKNWVVADRRLDPRMDPRDPDAKRYVN